MVFGDRATVGLAVLLAGLAAATTGCLGPLVDDAVERPTHVLPAGTEVPAVAASPELTAQIAAHDGVGALVPRLSGFAAGERVWYWTFGEAPAFSIPVFVLAVDNGDGSFTPVPGHLGIFDAVPGDIGYSPFWEVFFIPVTAAYDGEVLASFDAVEDARAEGLVGKEVRVGVYANCPVVDAAVRLEVGGGAEPLAPKRYYYKGWVIHAFDFGALPLADASDAVPVADVYVLNREGGEPLSEPIRGVDMTGDGDKVDSNNIFEVALDDPDYTPLWAAVGIVVPTDYKSIDEGDETVADYTAAGDLFTPDGEPDGSAIIAVKPMGLLLNCPLQRAAGGL